MHYDTKENDISSIGGRSLLNSLAYNTTVKTITGLYHNEIDRNFIIESISRILYSNLDTLNSAKKEQYRRIQYENQKRSSMNAGMDTLVEPLTGAGTGTGNSSGLPTIPTVEEVSEGSLDWADRLYNDDTELVSSSSVVITNLGEVSAIEKEDDQEKVQQQQQKLNNNVDNDVDAAAAAAVVVEPTTQLVSNINYRYADMPPPVEYFDRIMILQAAPLIYLSLSQTEQEQLQQQQPIPLHDFDYEISIIRNSLDSSSNRFDARIDIETNTASIDAFTTFMKASGSSVGIQRSRVLHFTGFGHPQHVFGFEESSTSGTSGCDGYLDDTFDLNKLNTLVKEASSLQLVVVNSYHSGRIGKAFVDAGVPHVVCCHHPELFRDKAANSFLTNFYRGLGSNKSLQQSFDCAQESIRVEEISKHVERYVLLPRRDNEEKDDYDPSYHDIPIFYTNPVSLVENNGADTKILNEKARNMLPKLPRYFIGREIEMCKVLVALRDTNTNIVRIGGIKGIGKASLAIAVCRYSKF